ncbi:MAG: T9SS type A sorting domain-containing protein, partial [Candidatus Cloacimonetes bacterium]|nr:T9SS type A sorting domain-containing protein [Candidatus Cloacimonadota bacterium]
SKSDDLGGLSATDASRVARFAVYLYEFNCLEMIAADVSMNGDISATDASRIARYSVLLIESLNDDGIDWVFTTEPINECEDWPPIVYENTREYSPLDTDLTDEDFIGIRLGDVTGNWSQDVRMPLTQKSSPPGADPSEETTEIEASINSILRMPIVIEKETAIEGMDISIAFNPEVLQLIEFTLNEGVLDNKDYAIETNLKDGKMVIYALSELASETGVVSFIEFDVIGDESSKTDVYFTKFDVNETEASGGFQIVDSDLSRLGRTKTGGAEVVTRRLEVNVVETLPEKFSLYPNYPNPFRNHTTISYALPEATNVKIQIYNIRGQLVAELVNGFEIAGNKKVVWNAEGYANGIYFCNITAGNHNNKIKLVLMK